jgi:hypothetical protein
MKAQLNTKSPEKRKWDGDNKNNKSKHKKVEDSVCALMLGPSKIVNLLYNNRDCSGILVLKKLTIQTALQEDTVFKSKDIQNKDIKSLLLYKFKIDAKVENKIGMQFLYKNVLYTIAENPSYLLISNKSKLLGKYLSENGYDYGLLSKQSIIVEDDDDHMMQKETEENIAKYRNSIQQLTTQKAHLLEELKEITNQTEQLSSSLQSFQLQSKAIHPMYLEALKAKEVLITNELEPDCTDDPALPQEFLLFLCIRCGTEVRQIVS